MFKKTLVMIAPILMIAVFIAAVHANNLYSYSANYALDLKNKSEILASIREDVEGLINRFLENIKKVETSDDSQGGK